MQHIGDFNYPRLADFGAAISGANKSQCQQVLEELDVRVIRFCEPQMRDKLFVSFLFPPTPHM